jgi:hypothetical protein
MVRDSIEMGGGAAHGHTSHKKAGSIRLPVFQKKEYAPFMLRPDARHAKDLLSDDWPTASPAHADCTSETGVKVNTTLRQIDGIPIHGCGGAHLRAPAD